MLRVVSAKGPWKSLLRQVGGDNGKRGTCLYSTERTSTGSWEKITYNGYAVNTFIPQPLPPKVDLTYSHPMLGISLSDSLAEADENLAELKQKAKTLPESLKTAFLKKEAVASCQVDLNGRTLNDVLKETCGFFHLRKPTEKAEVYDVLQYIEAMQVGLRLTEKSPLSMETVELIHRAGSVDKTGRTEVVPGKIRTSQVAVGTATPPYTNAFFPPPSKYIAGLMDNLMTFVNDQSGMHPLLKLGISHAQFETIHPFTQGNGQLGRVLLVLRLMQSGLIEKYTLYPSYAFKVVRWLYFNCLQETRDSGTWEGWLHFFVGALSHSARDAIGLCDDLLALREKQKTLLKGNGRREDIDEQKTNKLLDICYRMPYIQKQTVAVLFGEDYSIAHELLDLFVRKGILEIVRDEQHEIWYHNKSVCDVLNKERHIASYASMLGGWMRVPSSRETVEINEVVQINTPHMSVHETKTVTVHTMP